jgi:hypothetical protein
VSVLALEGLGYEKTPSLGSSDSIKIKGRCAVQIWVDADACPGAIKELLFRTAQRRQVKVTLVANQSMRAPPSEFIDTMLVPSGMNVADRRIVELAEPGDLVITADIPLAAAVVAKGAQALDPRGHLYTDANVGERLALRDLLDGLRGGGLVTGGPSNFNARDRQVFANQLDRWLTKAK